MRTWTLNSKLVCFASSGICGSNSAICCDQATKMSLSCSGGTGTNSTNSALGHVTPNLCFSFGVICGSRNAFWSVWGVKCRCTIFHARVGLVRFPQNAHLGTFYRTCVFACGGICGSNRAFCCDQAVKISMLLFLCSGRTGRDCTNSARNVDALFFMLVLERYRFHK
jgi:hypothetical protein